MWTFARNLAFAALVVGIGLGVALAGGPDRRAALHSDRASVRVAPSSAGAPAPSAATARPVRATTSRPARAAANRILRAGPLVGIAEQKASMFTSKPWKRLQVRDARYTTPWDTL